MYFKAIGPKVACKVIGADVVFLLSTVDRMTEKNGGKGVIMNLSNLWCL